MAFSSFQTLAPIADFKPPHCRWQCACFMHVHCFPVTPTPIVFQQKVPPRSEKPKSQRPIEKYPVHSKNTLYR